MVDCYVHYMLFAYGVFTSAGRRSMRKAGLCVFPVDLVMESAVDWMGERCLAFLV